MTADEVKAALGLAPHPREGGCFVRTWESRETVPVSALPDRYTGQRASGTAIYYLFEPDTFSEMHRLKSDEVFHFYFGASVEMLQLLPDGSSNVVVLGQDLAARMRPQLVVPQGVWQGSRMVPGALAEPYALIGCTVSPGFDFEDYESGDRASLIRDYPAQRAMIEALTRR